MHRLKKLETRFIGAVKKQNHQISWLSRTPVIRIYKFWPSNSSSPIEDTPPSFSSKKAWQNFAKVSQASTTQLSSRVVFFIDALKFRKNTVWVKFRDFCVESCQLKPVVDAEVPTKKKKNTSFHYHTGCFTGIVDCISWSPHNWVV